MNNNLHDLHVQGPTEDFRHDGDPGNFSLIPRGMALGINNNSYVALPDMPTMHRFYGQYNDILSELLGNNGSNRINAVFYAWEDHFFLAEEGINASADQIAAQLNGSTYSYMPYQHTREVGAANEALRRAGLNIRVGMPEAYGDHSHDLLSNRTGWSRDINNPEELSVPERYGINYPISINVTDVNRLSEAYNFLLNRFDNQTSFIKIDGSAGGFGVFKADCIEDVLRIQNELSNSEVLGQNYNIQVQSAIQISQLLSVQYRNGEIITPGGVSEQIVDDYGRWYMNVFNTEELEPLAANVKNQFNLVRNAARDQGHLLDGWGGFDGAKTNKNEVSLLEHNSMRLTGAIPGIEIAKSLGIDNRPFAFGKVLGNNQGELANVWELLKRNGLALDLAAKSGVFPALWVDHGAYVLVTGSDRADLMRQYNNVQNLFVREGLLIREG